MNTDSSHDPLDFDIPAPDHSLDSSLCAGVDDSLGIHHAMDLGSPFLHHAPLLGPLDHSVGLGAAQPHVSGGHVIGEPGSSGVWHQQQTPFTCAVVSEADPENRASG